MSKTLREIGIDCLGVDPFLKRIGLDGSMTIDELQAELAIARRARQEYAAKNHPMAWSTLRRILDMETPRAN